MLKQQIQDAFNLSQTPQENLSAGASPQKEAVESTNDTSVKDMVIELHIHLGQEGEPKKQAASVPPIKINLHGRSKPASLQGEQSLRQGLQDKNAQPQTQEAVTPQVKPSETFAEEQAAEQPVQTAKQKPRTAKPDSSVSQSRPLPAIHVTL